MPYRPLSVLTRAEVLTTDGSGVTLKGTASDGGSLAVQVVAAGEGVIRVRGRYTSTREQNRP
jgi:alpha-D-xyloside xylohydrolase